MNKERLAVARGDMPADLVFMNGKILDIYNGCWVTKPLAVHQGILVGFGDYEGISTVDLQGKWLIPGLIDAHMHLESSMLTPERFSELVLPKGTVTVMADPHEIANVCGTDGIEYLLESNPYLDLDLFVMLPSCVPATSIETSGAELTAEDLEKYMQHPGVLGLGEMMNYPGVIFGDDQVHKKLELAKKQGKIIDGHIEPDDLKGLNAYAMSGIEANHECTSPKQARATLQAGLALMIREGTAARNLEALLPVVDEYSRSRCMFCTDDRHPDHIESQGHIDYLVRRSIEKGMDPIMAIRMSSLNTAQFFGLKDRGAIAPGKKADLLILKDLQQFEVSSVYKDGCLVAKDGEYLGSHKQGDIPERLIKGLNFPSIKPQDLLLKLGKRNMAIELIPGEIMTRKKVVSYEEARQLKKIAVIERHHGSGNIGLGLVKGFDFKGAAIASTVAHDSHNLIVVGDNDEDMLLAIEETRKLGGGLVLSAGGEIRASLALPIAGLLSNRPYIEVKLALLKLKSELQKFGQSQDFDPFMTLSFLALPVLPEIRITDRGLFDVTIFDYIDNIQ
ncbi:adenine deaminase [Clostridia bacterium]|nr:adenine deaminase [Clostridia bacterium]